jgi:hypothetical protein
MKHTLISLMTLPVLTPPYINKNAEEAVTKLVPKVSNPAYKAYKVFMEWIATKEVGSFSKSVILVYLEEKQKVLTNDWFVSKGKCIGSFA